MLLQKRKEITPLLKENTSITSNVRKQHNVTLLQKVISFMILAVISFQVFFFKNVVIGKTNNNNSSSSSNSKSERTSLEILDTVVQTMKETRVFQNHTASCFVPNTARTADLLTRLPTMGQPVLNVGFPKSGSTTLYEFFQCKGWNATHQHNMDNICMRDAAAVGLPPLTTCAPTVEAFLQLDTNWPIGSTAVVNIRDTAQKTYWKTFKETNMRDECFFPQISLLDQFHQEAPNATFILTFRPIDSWIASVKRWYDMHTRLTQCHLPGFPRNMGQNDSELTFWWCSHVTHIRNFVEQHPSHHLIELDLYDNESSERAMVGLFDADPKCWGHANENSGKQRRHRL